MRHSGKGKAALVEDKPGSDSNEQHDAEELLAGQTDKEHAVVAHELDEETDDGVACDAELQQVAVLHCGVIAQRQQQREPRDVEPGVVEGRRMDKVAVARKLDTPWEGRRLAETVHAGEKDPDPSDRIA